MLTQEQIELATEQIRDQLKMARRLIYAWNNVLEVLEILPYLATEELYRKAMEKDGEYLKGFYRQHKIQADKERMFG